MTDFGNWAGSDKPVSEFPYFTRLTVAYPDRLTRTRSVIDYFRTRDEAIAFFNLPKKGIEIELLVHNGGAPGKHLDRIAKRKIGKKAVWF